MLERLKCSKRQRLLINAPLISNNMRSPPFLFVYIGIIAAVVTASALYWFTQNPNEQPMRPGDYHVILASQGNVRSYDLHVPPHYDGKSPLPLVFALHELGGDAATFANSTGLNERADAEGFFVVYPQGLNNSWNAGTCCGSSSQQKVDDAGFIKMLLIRLKSDLVVNDSRVYAIGVSNGGMLAYRLACDFSQDFAAIAPLAATSVVEHCNATRPVSVIAFHGTTDEVIPYNETARSKSAFHVPPAVDAVSYWALHDGTVSTQQQQVASNVTATIYSGGSNGTEVVLYSLNGGGHGSVNPVVAKIDLIWRFFQQHPRL
jgi:polyhydroxybutyrate depolymerase